MRISSSVLIFLLGAIASAKGQPMRDVDDILEKAINAHGGNAKVKRTASALKVKGTFFADGIILAHSGSIQAQGEDCCRAEIKTAAWNHISVLNGDKGWIRDDVITRPMSKEELADAQENVYTDWVSTLVPLRGKDFVISSLGAAKLGDRALVGLRVSRKGRRDVDLYFDRVNGLFVKRRIIRLGNNGKEMEYVTVFENFRDFDGVKFPTKWVSHRDGQRRFEFEVIEVRFVERLPADTFAKP